jgi:hypothetical protein
MPVMTESEEAHPTDQLIRDLIAHPRSATEQEIQLITDRIADAPFNRDLQKVPVPLRGLDYRGGSLGTQLTSVVLHFIQHVEIEKQWAPSTTIEAYIESLHRTARVPEAQIALYRQWGTRDIAAIIVPTEKVLDSRQMGSGTLPNLLVVYGADRGMLVSGYQFRTMDNVRIPKDAVWLK